MGEDQLHAAVRQRAQAGPLAARSQQFEVVFQVAQVAVDAQHAARLAGESVEVLVARQRPGLAVQALEQPVEEVAHRGKI